MRFKMYLLLLFLSSFNLIHSQQSIDYIPFQKEISTEKNLLASIKKRFQEDISALNSNNKKYIADIYKERFEYIKERFETNEIITDNTIQNYLNSLVNEIVQHNPSLTHPNNLRILFSKAWWANASSFGEGTILFNIGLFHRLENEAQVAFVLSHELAHYYLNHGNNSIHQYIHTLYSDEMQQQLKKIDRSDYHRNNQLETLALNMGFKNRRHTREHEKAADSMAVVLLKNTAFDIKEAIACLSILDMAEKDKYHTSLQLDQLWNFTAFPFKKRWLASNTLTFVSTKEEKDKKKVLADSLKTHPDCKARIATLKNMIAGWNTNNGKSFIVDENKFLSFKKVFDFEILEFSFASNKVSTCLYLALQMHRSDPENSYVNGIIGKCLNAIYTAQKNHELGKIIDLPNDAYDEEYNQLLHLLQNIRLNELAAINYYFMANHEDKGKQSQTFLMALIKSKENFDKPEEKAQWIQYYTHHFPNTKNLFK